MNRININFNDITPNVRFINLLQCKSDFCEGPRMIYDHQFIYVHKGKGFVEVGKQRHAALLGDLFFYGPKTVHRLIADPQEPFLLTGIHFDFTQNYKSRPFPIGPFNPECFNDELVTESVGFTNFSGLPSHMNVANDQTIEELIFTMLHEFNSEKLFYAPLINGLFSAWLSRVARHVMLRGKNIDNKDDIVGSVIKYIQVNFNNTLTNETIGAKFNFHPNYLNQLIIANTGVSLRQYIINLRIKKAMDMLVNSHLTITQICNEVGYDSIHYFSRLFKKKTGFTPGDIRNRKN